MNSLNIIRFIRGFLRIKIIGDGAERFINLCSKNKISIWDIKTTKNGFIICLNIKDYKKVRKLRRKIKFPPKLRIHSKHGLPVILKSYESRKGIVVGACLSLIILYVLSGFIWDIEISGNKTISETKIISACEELGVKKGIRKRKIDSYNLRPRLVLMVDNIAWCSFNVEGSVLTIDISEAKDSSKNQDNIPSNLIATEDGVIISTEIEKGTKTIEVGQAVRKGDLLVSGTMMLGEKTSLIKSSGKVIAQTEKEFIKCIPITYKEKVFSGKVKKLSVLDFFGIKIPLFLGNVTYNAETTVAKKNINFFKKELPISVITKTFKEIKFLDKNRSEDEAINQALSEIALDIKKHPIINVKTTDFSWKNKGDYIEVHWKGVCSQDIATEEKIIIHKEN